MIRAPNLSPWLLRAALCSLLSLLLLSACGGGGGSTPASSQTATAPVGASFTQQANNLSVVVDAGPAGLGPPGVVNILYADVTLCAPGSRTQCVTIDHVQVDTGSVGLRVLRSRVAALGLPAVSLGTDTNGKATTAQECYPFVLGGLWGPTAVADIGLGQRWANGIPVHLIEDGASPTLAVPQNCVTAANGQIMNSVNTLGSNGILGIGSVTLDCGQTCVTGNYSGTFVQYYRCAVDATSSSQCSAAAVPSASQVFNPVSGLDSDNNGLSLSMPQISGLGASSAQGELVFGLNTRSNNQVPATLNKINLGVQPLTNPRSYLNITTVYKGRTFSNSYLDTGSNALFFNDSSIAVCSGSTWYCPASALALSATLSDGDQPTLNTTSVAFNVNNANSYFATSNKVLGDLAGTGSSSRSFAWGLPFFYGRRVYLSIWNENPTAAGPWYGF